MSFPYFRDDIQGVFLKDFGVDTTVTKDDATTFEMRGIVNSDYEKARVGGYRVDTQNLSLLVEETDDVSSIRRNDVIEMDGTSYKVVGQPESNGTGMALIRMMPADTLNNAGDTYTSI